ncbi:unnamed protein product [Ectocarpus sp. 6 AP-2014]
MFQSSRVSTAPKSEHGNHVRYGFGEKVSVDPGGVVLTVYVFCHGLYISTTSTPLAETVVIVMIPDEAVWNDDELPSGFTTDDSDDPLFCITSVVTVPSTLVTTFVEFPEEDRWKSVIVPSAETVNVDEAPVLLLICCTLVPSGRIVVLDELPVQSDTDSI